MQINIVPRLFIARVRYVELVVLVINMEILLGCLLAFATRLIQICLYFNGIVFRVSSSDIFVKSRRFDLNNELRLQSELNEWLQIAY